VGDEKERPEVILKAVMSRYEGAKTRVPSWIRAIGRISCGIWSTPRISASLLLFAIVVDVVTKCTRKGLINEILYADDSVLTSKSMEELQEKLKKWKEAFESKGMKANLAKTKMMVSRSEGERLNSMWHMWKRCNG